MRINDDAKILGAYFFEGTDFFPEPFVYSNIKVDTFSDPLDYVTQIQGLFSLRISFFNLFKL